VLMWKTIQMSSSPAPAASTDLRNIESVLLVSILVDIQPCRTLTV